MPDARKRKRIKYMSDATSGSILGARELVKSFGDLDAVKGVSFSVERGESFGFLGPNGAGKTSTMRMISAVSKPSSGTLSILASCPKRTLSNLSCRCV
jgi:lipooligosaccharide transport system ATP-binding protein